MRLIRPGMMLGFAAGYVLGTKAGRERYYQIEAMWRKAMRTPQAQQLTNEVRQTVQAVGEVVEQKASDGVAQVASTLNQAREKVEQAADQQTGARAF